ncbi:50S ribosomal protein L25/general stress protein Ctc [Corynebacterium maris DSM 45190]|uniref:Large ribosomal subunit protein bL25 n=1 Tax=Corynebacterium maris DSM 45190 TaxID=1224163 RepID=S5STG7_9CORY|nr:50S ribosomal protein L25/general stress protein Ctc [Corynebacterium maris]AGS34352.1 50S ribosomal protein L25/general stress protein Ctc [Corynebacterium maris DSM 45190]
MAETTVIKAEARTEFGKGAARRLRRDFRLPGVIYGTHHEPIHFHADLLEIHTLLRYEGVNAVVEIAVDGEQHLCMVKAIDQNVLTLDVDHLDMLSIKRGEKVEVEVPVVTEGEVFSGAMLIQELDTLTIVADALKLPEEILVSVEGIEAGNQILAGDITLPEGVELIDEADALVLNITHEEVADVPEEGEEADAEATEAAPAAEENE